MKLLVAVMFLWIALDSSSVGFSAYAEYAESLSEMNRLIEESVLKDIHSIEAAGVPRSMLSPLGSYLERYVMGIHEIQEVRMEEDGILIIISRPYIRRMFLDYALQTVLLLTFSALILAEYQFFINYTSQEAADEPDTI